VNSLKIRFEKKIDTSQACSVRDSAASRFCARCDYRTSMEAPVLKFATLATALVVTSAFASTAEARGGGGQFAIWLAHQGQNQSHENWEESRGSPHVSHCEKKRERELEEIRAEQAREAAAQAAEAKRARLLALQRQQGEKLAAAKRARAQALQQKEAVAAKQPAPAVADAAPKGDMLPAATTSSANITTASLKTAVADQSSLPSDTSSVRMPDVCRRYSPAADGLVEVPCK
jgi:hypothetical protein